MSFGGTIFILPGERGVVAKEGLWMVLWSPSIRRISEATNRKQVSRHPWPRTGFRHHRRPTYDGPMGEASRMDGTEALDMI
jgi:hypothetical protein